MNNNQNIIELAKAIVKEIDETGACVQLYGSWNKETTEEERAELAAQLRKNNIETIKLYDYAELYIAADLDSEKKEQVIAIYKEKTPVAFEEAVVEYHRRRTVIDSFACAVAEAMLEIVGDESDNDDDEGNDEK